MNIPDVLTLSRALSRKWYWCVLRGKKKEREEYTIGSHWTKGKMIADQFGVEARSQSTTGYLRSKRGMRENQGRSSKPGSLDLWLNPDTNRVHMW